MVCKTVTYLVKSNLIGNPYPSAIDGDAFILANSGDSSASLSGTLYFGRMDLRYKLEAILMLQKQVQGRMLILLMIILRIR
jgi:hypothetical protein